MNERDETRTAEPAPITSTNIPEQPAADTRVAAHPDDPAPDVRTLVQTPEQATAILTAGAGPLTVPGYDLMPKIAEGGMGSCIAHATSPWNARWRSRS